MKRTKEICTSRISTKRKTFLTAALFVALVLFGGLCADSFCMVSRAESEAVVTAGKGINIRKEPNSSSEVIGGQEPDKVISVKSQVQGGDGYTWYEVYIDSYTTGWVRSDLVRITDGTTPPTGSAANTTPSDPTPPPAGDPGTSTEEPPAQVTRVNPVGGVVAGGPVNIYSNVSAASQLITTAADGLSVTINGTAYSTDGKFWYQVNFMDNGADVIGFIDSAYVTPSGELTAYTEPVEPVDPDPPVDPAPPEEPKAYDTRQEGEIWYLVDNTGDEEKKDPIEKLLDIAKQGQEMIDEANAKANRNQVIVIVLVFLLVGAAVVIGFLVFKVKDMMDSAYYKEVERDTMKRRETGTSRGSGQRVMTTVGGTSPGQRSGSAQGSRLSGSSQGARPAGNGQGARPAGTPQGARPSGGAQGARPSGTSQGVRPAGTSQGTRSSGAPQGARPGGPVQGARPAGAPQGTRPAGVSQGTRSSGAPQGARPGGPAQGARPAGTSQAQKPAGSQGWKSRNFMSEDEDEFEFEFLNYDGDEE